jgi:hypothetical protein
MHIWGYKTGERIAHIVGIILGLGECKAGCMLLHCQATWTEALNTPQWYLKLKKSANIKISVQINRNVYSGHRVVIN